jgi:predicted Zn finger-like uncharacterized protein
MSLKTRCPACDTVFKIVPDQLKVSKGWVRCGRCAEVFDAAAHAASTEDVNQWPQTSAVTTAPVMTSPLAAPSETSKKTPKNIAIQAINTPATAIFTSKNEVNTNTTDEPDLSFVRIAKNKAFWQRTAVTRALGAACIGLAGLLFMQVVYSQRNHLAASNASFKSVLEAVCQTIGCIVEPYKNIDAFKIDSSSFQKIPSLSIDNAHAEVFSLKLSLKNNADAPLAMPAVELTLTEAGDKPVLRRVLLSKELGFSGTTLAANADWSGAATIAVTPNPAAAPVSGYRVLLFYP